MAASPLADEIRLAPTLYSLGVVAERARLEDALALDLEQLVRRLDASAAAIATLAEVRRKGRVTTLGELLRGANPTVPRWRAPRAVAVELLGAVKGLLLGSLVAPASWSSRAELCAWAEGAGVAELLTTPIHRLPGLPPELAVQLRRARADGCAIVDAVFSDDFGGARVHAALGAANRALLADRASLYLRELAASIEETRARADAARDAWPPRDAPSGLVRAGERLLSELDERIRLARVVPLARVEDARCGVMEDPPAIVLTMRAPRALASDPLVPVRVTLSLGTAGSSCDCAHTRRAPCGHVAAAILLVLGVLRDPKQAVSRDVARIVETPSWARTLDALDAALRVPAADDAADKRVAWRLSVGHDGGVSLWPVVQLRRAKGWTKGAKMSWWEARTLCAGTFDRRVHAALHESSYVSTPSPAASARALLELCGHPNVQLADAPDRPIEVVEAKAALRAVAREEGAVELVATVDGVELPPSALLAALDAQGDCGIAALVDREDWICRVVTVPGRLQLALRALGGRATEFPQAAVGPLLERLQVLQQVAPVDVAPSIAGREVEPDDTVVLRLERGGTASLTLAALVRPLEGGAAFEPGAGPALAVAARDGERVCVRRDADRERARVEAVLRTLPLQARAEGERFAALHGDEALELLLHLSERESERGVAIEWPKSRPTISRPAHAADVRAEVSRQRDWFGLSGGIEVDGVTVDLALALDAARRGSRFVEAGPELVVRLADELREKLAAAAEQVYAGRNGLELSFAAAPAIEALVEDGTELEAAREFSRLLGRIRASRALEVPVPEGLRAELRPYQVEGFRWLARLAAWGAGGCLADDMGLGKTLQSLALLLHRAEQGPALVVAPTSVCGNWLRELERFAPGLRPVLYGARSDAEREALELAAGDLLVVSYGLLARDAERLSRFRFATAIFDEAQALKNPQTERAQAARRIDADVRIALSGTPLENHLGELWSLYRVVLPGLLGSSEQFRERFALPIERGDAARRRALGSVLRPFLLRRGKDEVAPELPPRTEIDVGVELSAGERRLYDEARLAAVAKVEGLDGSVPPEKRRFEILAALTRLRLCACHPMLYDARSELSSAKLRALVETIDELREEGHRALVFSQFTKLLDLAEEALRRAGATCLRLDGSTPAAKRQALVDRWQAEAADAFLVSLKAGGTGLNLTAADYVIHLDPWWNPAAEDQATDRAHRIGQTKPVTVLRLVARGTIEEQILGLHGEKRALLASVLDGADGGVRADPEALLALLQEAPGAADPEDEPAAEAPAPVAEEPRRPTGGGTEAAVPACLGAGDPVRLAEELRRFLETRHAAGAIGPGPVKSYPRAVGRFAEFVARGNAARLADAPFEAVRDHYLESLRSGAWPAPSSEPTLARSALGQLQAMLRGMRRA